MRMWHTEKAVGHQHIYSGRIYDVERYDVELETGARAVREVIRHPGGACVVAVDAQDCLLMVRQFRFPAGRELLELPAGKLEPNEDPMTAALRELEEETGFRTDRLELLSAALPTPAYCSEVLYIYLAGALERTAQHLDADEHLSVERIPFDTAVRMVRAGEIPDAKTQIGILLAEARRRPGACGWAADATDGKGAKQ